MEVGPRLFALRPWDDDIADLMRVPTVQACSLPTGRVLYFALPIPGYVLTWLEPQELLELYRHLEGTLGLLGRASEPGTVDYLAAFMQSTLAHISHAGLPAPVPNHIPIGLAGVQQLNATGNPDPHMLAWINSGFQGHPPPPFQPYPSLPHPLVSGINNDTGYIEQGKVNPMCNHYWRVINSMNARDYEDFVYGVVDLVRDSLGGCDYFLAPGPTHPERDTFYAWKEHHRYDAHDLDALEQASHNSLKPASPIPRDVNVGRGKHQQNQDTKRTRSHGTRKITRSRSLEPHSQTISPTDTQHNLLQPSFSDKILASLNEVEDSIMSLTDEEMELLFSHDACLAPNVNDGYQLKLGTPSEHGQLVRAYVLGELEGLDGLCDRCLDERLHLAAEPSRKASDRQSRRVISKHTEAGPHPQFTCFPELEEQQSLKYADFMDSVISFSKYLSNIGYEFTDEQRRELLQGGKSHKKFLSWWFSADGDVDKLYQHLLRFKPTEKITATAKPGPRRDYFMSMSKSELYLYCKGLFDVVSDRQGNVDIECPLFPRYVHFTGSMWRDIIFECLPTDFRVLSLKGGQLESLYNDCVRHLKLMSANIKASTGWPSELGFDRRAKADGEGSADSWAEDEPPQFPVNSMSPNPRSGMSSRPRKSTGDSSDGTSSSIDVHEKPLSAFIEKLTKYELDLVTRHILKWEKDDSEIGWRLVPSENKASLTQKKGSTPSNAHSKQSFQATGTKSGGSEGSTSDLDKKFDQKLDNTFDRKSSKEPSKKAGKRPVSQDPSGWDLALYEHLLNLDTERLHRKFHQLSEQPRTLPSVPRTSLHTPPLKMGYRSPPTSRGRSRHAPPPYPHVEGHSRESSTSGLQSALNADDWTYIGYDWTSLPKSMHQQYQYTEI